MPDWAPEIRRRLASLHLSPTRELEIVEELSQHLDDRWRELVAGGTSPDDATRLALADFTDEGHLTRFMTPLRQSHQPAPIAPGTTAGHVLVDLWRDVRYALRTMASSPGFSTVAILSLALGIGANAAIFSLWNGVLHASLPGVDKPGELVMLSNPNDSGSWTGNLEGPRSWLTYEEFEQQRDHVDAFSGVMASQSSLDSWQVRFDDSDWEEVSGRLVSGGFFNVLGVRPTIGRVFTPADDARATPDAVISYSFWRRRFGGRPDILGKTFALRTTVFTIAGVAPAGFVGETIGQQPDLWLPLRMQPSIAPDRDRLHDTPPIKSMWLHVFARLKPGVTPAQAEGRANAVFKAGLESFYGSSPAERRDQLLDQRLAIHAGARGASSKRPEFSQSLSVLLAAVGLLLLIACANLANLLLARGTARTAEMALRVSLGASRGRLVRQLVTESLTLAVLGAAAALGVAVFMHGGLVRMIAAGDSDFRMTFALDPAVVGFIVATTILATLIFGVLPAWQLTRADVAASLNEPSRGAAGRVGRLGSGRLLVSLQLALSLPLLVGAGLLVRTLYNLQHADLGYPASRLLVVWVDLREAGVEPARRAGLLQQVLDEVRRVPGVRSASFSELGVFSGGESSSTITVEGFAPRADRDRGSALDVVGPGYFAALGVPIALGRDVLDSDQAGTPAVCLINEAFAARFFENRNPIGLHITQIGERDRSACQVIGVARNARTDGLRDDVRPRFFKAALQTPSSAENPFLLVRTTLDTAHVASPVRKAIQRIDARLPIISSKTLEERMAPLTAQDRLTAQLAVAFGMVALTLAAIGLYGVLSYGVVRRTTEIAIRIALGAQRMRVVAMILGETSVVVAVGLALGSALAYAASRLIGSRLYGVAPQDPLTIGLATGLLVAVAALAAYLPARRASRLDPMAALRQG